MKTIKIKTTKAKLPAVNIQTVFDKGIRNEKILFEEVSGFLARNTMPDSSMGMVKSMILNLLSLIARPATTTSISCSTRLFTKIWLYEEF